MTKATEFAVRDSAGGVARGVAGGGAGSVIQMGAGEKVSLNLSRAGILGYERDGADLIVTLDDGSRITLAGFFAEGAANELYISADGDITAVELQGTGDGPLYAAYGPVAHQEKWSALDDLRFLASDTLAEIVPGDDPAGMAVFVPAMLGGLAGPAAAVAGGAVLLASVSGGGSGSSDGNDGDGSGDGGDGGGGDGGGGDGGGGDGGGGDGGGGDGGGGGGGGDGGGPARPTVDDPDRIETITTRTEVRDRTITGTGEPGDSVTVHIGDITQTTSIREDGTWSVTFPGDSLPPDGSYDSDAVFTHGGGGTTTLDGPDYVIDLTPPPIEVTEGFVSTGDIESAAEHVDGVTLRGRGEAGASLTVEIDGASHSTTVAEDGTWTVTFTPVELPAGQYVVGATLISDDIHGNRTIVAEEVRIDTAVDPFTRVIASGGPDGVINAVESAQGLTVTGTVEAGSSVAVQIGGGDPVAATVTGTTWTVTFPAAALPRGERSLAVTATATDAVGNTATLAGQVGIDTLVRDFARTGGEIGGDGILNAAEVAAGLTLTGTVEPHASVEVRLSNGASQTVDVGAGGRWSVTFDAADLPTGERDARATITATDRAGNRATITEDFAIDTVAPDTPDVRSFTRDAAGLRGIGTVATDDSYAFVRINENGSQTAITARRSDDTDFGETRFAFGSSAVPDGSYLVINTGDAAGNTTSTLLIVDNTTATAVDLSRSGLRTFDFSALDLTFAPDASLTITAAQLQALTGPDRELIVKGDSDDTVTARGAVATGETVRIDGQDHAVYTLGSHGARLILDDDISLNA